METERRKSLQEFWLSPQDLLALPDVWIEIDSWSYYQSTHELAKAGFSCKIVSNARATPKRPLPVEFTLDRGHKDLKPILSEKVTEPFYGAGTTSLRFFKPMLSHTKFNLRIRLFGFHHCPETVWQDLVVYNYYWASTTINVALNPKKPDLKTADMILDKIPSARLIGSRLKHDQTGS